MAPQLTATIGPLARWLLRCKDWATSSLPVPDSPRTRMGAMLPATLAMRSRTCCITRDGPINSRWAGRADRAGVPGCGAA